MQIFRRSGVVFRSGSELLVDASGIKGREALITHAHSDHAKPTSSNTYYMTSQTRALLGQNAGRQNMVEVPFGKKFRVGGFECSFRPSGHILGSAQLEVANGSHAVFTSDFKLQKSILFEGAEILPAETLVIETTFGTPEYSFPERDVVYEDIIRWVHSMLGQGRFVVLGGYSTGKAQELTKVCSELLGEAPLVYGRVFEQNRAYESQGVKLGDYIALDNNFGDANVLIMPPHLIDDSLLAAIGRQLGKKAEAAIATGWGLSKYKSFPLSDHADFNALLRYVKESAPKLVLTTHGFEKEFAGHVRKKLGINARPLSRDGQEAVTSFSG
ncbi:MAG: hypothetical protein HY544_05390 [Candidatus Diapherotrites archaeon]|uniref:MBL fold metallo-hydrolase n=1 Tax=Candidatus Iainarchaeum sp. TaxID=3101447 RepID=A0A8T3YLI1_9ARCH|nr:hypothetical protein [Candidatus Diapherotrites archaeon]